MTVSAKRKQIKVSPKASSDAALNDEVARVAISEEGEIIYASQGFYALSKTPRKKGVNFHFEWATLPENKHYLIGSESRDNNDLKKFEAQLPTLKKQDPKSITQPEDLQFLLNMSHEIMVITDQEGQITATNHIFQTLFGYTDQDLGHLNFPDLLKQENKDQTPAANFKAQIKTKNGQVRQIEWRRIEKNNRVYYSGQDITAIKTQEEALEKREKQLSQAEAIGRMGHWHWTVGQDTIEWSDEIFRIFGVERQTFKPSLRSMNAMVHRHDIDRVNQALQRAIITGNDYDMEFCLIQPSGEERFIRCEGRCARDKEGEIIALFGIMQDMTERMIYERELKEAKDSSERAYAAKTQFLANMSHELRTPLNAIIGFSEMMQRQLLGPIGTEKYMDYIDGIRKSGEHLLDLISDILDMSKIEAGKYELMLEEVNVSKIIKLALHMMEGRAQESSIKLEVTGLENEDLQIIADRRALLQILLNLISNSIKFTDNGGCVTVECLSREDGVTIKVRDNGMGIPANKLASITQPFEQVSSSYARDHEGSGLGLAITKELAEMHNGSLYIESTVGVGTIVTVRLRNKTK